MRSSRAGLGFALVLFALGASAAESGPRDVQELEQLIAGVMNVQLSRCHVPGAVFLLVKDGQVFFAKGYGYADLEQKRPVEAEKTLFRVYSVSKAVSATAVMQLVEQGKLALSRDVNSYLSPKGIPSTFPQPITLGDLLTHTSGLDDRYVFRKPAAPGFSIPANLIPLEQYLARQLPPRLVPPGQVIRYSNHNLVLAGYLVEAASGQSFAQYMDEHVLGPLEMRHSSWWDSPKLVPDLAAGYSFSKGAYRRLAVSGSCNPASSLIATATDMGHFMIAQLQQGRYGGQQILKPDTVRQMQSAMFTFDPQLPGVGYGFWERFMNGERTIEHVGDAPGFITIMRLLPARNQGLLISVNCNQGGPLLRAVEQSYFDKYFPYTPPPLPAQASSRTRLTTAVPEGYYRRDFTPATGIEKLLVLTRGGEQVRVVPARDGVTLQFGPYQRKYIEEAPLVFRETSGSDRIGFKQSSNGHWLLIFGSYGVLEKLPFYDTFGFQVLWLLACVILLASFIGIWPIVYLVRRLRNQRGENSRLGRWAVAAAVAVSLVTLTGVVASALVLFGAIQTDFMLGASAGTPAFISALLVLPPLEAALACVVVGFAIVAWQRRLWALPARIHYSLVAAAGMGMAVWYEHWNLLRWWFVQ